MTNHFERFGIAHLSPSSLNLYAANPSLWCLRYLYKVDDAMGPAAHRGTAVEDGLSHWLQTHDITASANIALDRFASLTHEMPGPETEAERANILPMLVQAQAACKEYGNPEKRQLRVEHLVDGVAVPIIGYSDFEWRTFGIDLKTTKQCPSQPRDEHVRQVSLYAKCASKPFRLVYVTGKKSATYQVGDNTAANGLADLERIARSVQHLLARSETPDEAAQIFSPDYSDFRWSPTTRDSAQQVWR